MHIIPIVPYYVFCTEPNRAFFSINNKILYYILYYRCTVQNPCLGFPALYVADIHVINLSYSP